MHCQPCVPLLPRCTVRARVGHSVTGFVEFDSEAEAQAALKFNGHKFSTDGDEVGIGTCGSTRTLSYARAAA